MEVIDTEARLCISVGEATFEQIFNVLEEPVDNLGPLDTWTISSIQKSVSDFIRLDTQSSIFQRD